MTRCLKALILLDGVAVPSNTNGILRTARGFARYVSRPRYLASVVWLTFIGTNVLASGACMTTALSAGLNC